MKRCWKKNTDNYYSTFDAVRILGIKLDRLQDWLRRGFIRPSHQIPGGKGQKKLFDLWGLYMIKLFQHFLVSGISRKQAEIYIRLIEGLNPEHEEVSNEVIRSHGYVSAVMQRAGYFPKYIKLVRRTGEDPTVDFIYDYDAIEIAINGDTHFYNFKNIVQTVNANIDT